MRKDLEAAEAENHRLRARNSKLLRGQFTVVTAPHIARPIDNDKTLDEYLADFEMQIIERYAEVLRRKPSGSCPAFRFATKYLVLQDEAPRFE